ncbi:uncharacterized protein LOC111068427 [Drosophila obscura]|uniref:uncharacterized protein LOC111068427 n=1 Tax=Drosophila obscura TaxID=7282 RepID=UPI001BB130AF|nr:uncharacterized protein LOC111068427 [Drosophila obscura]
MAQDQAGSQAPFPSSNYTVTFSSSDDGLDVDFEDVYPETSSSAEAKLFGENSAVPSSTVPPTAVPSTTFTTAAVPSKTVLTLLADNPATLSLSKILLSDILAINRNITLSLDKQKESVLLIRHAESLLLKATKKMSFMEAELHRGFVKAIRKIDGHANHIIDDVAYMLQLQDENKKSIDRVSVKIRDIQSKILRSSKGFDRKLHRLRQIIQQNIKFEVLNLNLTAGSLSISQIKSLAELESLPIVWKNSKRRDMQLTSLQHQLSILNKSQKRSLNSLREVLQKWAPTNLASINDQLQSLINSQKRTELDLAVCDRDSSKKYNDPSSDE